MRVPKYILNSNRSAIILPIFFFNHTSLLRRCTSVENCAFMYVVLYVVYSSSNWYQPESKLELVDCIHTLNCYSNKQLIRTHVIFAVFVSFFRCTSCLNGILLRSHQRFLVFVVSLPISWNRIS